MKDKTKNDRLFYLYLVAWMAADLLQSVFMEIHADEAYYALYGQFLRWGYYDHPPMVGLMTHLSSLLAAGNLSVRLCTVLLHGATLLVVRELVGGLRGVRDDVRLFFVMAASLVMFVAYGFMTTPDAPLLFFGSLFLLGYKRFLAHGSWTNALWMSVTMAGMIYSKYHGMLVVVLVVLSNLRLLRNGRFWVAGLLALALLTPHVMWQVEADFPSLKYHLMERSRPFSWAYPLEYWPNQLAVFNPFMLGLGLYLCWKRRRTTDLFERALIFLTVGFLAFFWGMTARGHAEPHWTVMASVPLLVLAFRCAAEDTRLRRYTLRYVGTMTVLVVVARVVLCLGVLPERIGFNGKRDYHMALASVTGDTPVVFKGSFQQASLHRFFTHTRSVVLSELGSRRTQFDLLALEDSLQGRPAYIMRPGAEPNHQVGRHAFHCYRTDSLQCVNRLRFDAEHTAIEGDSLRLEGTVSNPYHTPVAFDHPYFPVTVQIAYLYNNEYHVADAVPHRPAGRIDAGASTRIRISAPLPEGWDALPECVAALCLHTEVCTSVNSDPIDLKTDLRKTVQ